MAVTIARYETPAHINIDKVLVLYLFTLFQSSLLLLWPDTSSICKHYYSSKDMVTLTLEKKGNFAQSWVFPSGIQVFVHGIIDKIVILWA